MNPPGEDGEAAQSAASRPILVVVAHPDDESIWFGGALRILARGFPTHIISATHGSDPVRSGEFREACAMLGAQGHLLDMPDGGGLSLPDIQPGLDAYLREHLVAPHDLACVITHSPAGEEHWHRQHRDLHWQVSDWARAHAVDFGFFASQAGWAAFSPLLCNPMPWTSWWRGFSKKDLIIEAVRLLRCLARYRHHGTVIMRVDAEAKASLLEIYSAQSLVGYGAYSSGVEYLSTRNAELAKVLRTD